MAKETEDIKISADPESKDESLVAVVTTTREEKIYLDQPDKVFNSIGSLRFTQGMFTFAGMVIKLGITWDGVQRMVEGAAHNDLNTMYNGIIEAGAGLILSYRSLNHGLQQQSLIGKIRDKLIGKIRSGLIENLDQ